MSAFKDMVQCDNDNVFFNVDEMATEHKVSSLLLEEKLIPLIIDEDELQDLKLKADFSSPIFSANMLFYVKEKDIGYRPSKNSMLKIDDRKYRVIEASFYADGVYKIICEAPQ